MKFSIVLIFLSFFIHSLPAQDCTDYHQYHCTFADYTYFLSRQSTSFLSNRGQSTEVRMVAYGDEDYYVAVCAHRKFGDLHLKIFEDNAARNLIYDNAENEFQNWVEFTNQTTRNLIIEVTVPEGKSSADDRRCVGVVIQFRKTDG